MSEIIQAITPFLQQHRYIFAFLGALCEGSGIMLLCGFLYKLGIFKFWNIFVVLTAGYILNGYVWYIIGRFGGEKILKKWGHHFLSEERMKKLEEYYNKHTTKALIITRATYGLSMYMFIIAGIFKTKAKQFFWCSFIAAIIWVSMLFALGYSFGASYELLSKIIRLIAGWLMAVLFVVIVLIAMGLVFWLRRRARAKFIEKSLDGNSWKRLKLLGKKIGKFLSEI